VLVLEVFVNGKRIARAGASDLSVLGAHITGSGKLGHGSRGMKSETEKYEVDLSVGGLTSRPRTKLDEHLRWGSRKSLKIGDEVLIRVLESTVADAPSDSTPADRKRPKITEREVFRMSKEAYFRLRGKYDKRRATSRSAGARRTRRGS